MFNKSSVTSSLVSHNKRQPSCYLCKDTHPIYFCEQLLNLNSVARTAQINKLKLCINCLKPSHRVQNCKANTCSKCKHKHHTLLHIDNQLAAEPTVSAIPGSSVNCSQNSNFTQIMLSIQLLVT